MAGLNIQGLYLDNTTTAAASAGVLAGHWRVFSAEDGIYAVDSNGVSAKLNDYNDAVAYTNMVSGDLTLIDVNLQEQINNLAGGGADLISYTNLTPTPEKVGGIEAGSTFNADTLTEMFDALLYPYQYPAFSSFSIAGQASSIEVGESTPVNPTFNWATSNSSNITGSNVAIYDQTGSATIASGLDNDGSEATTYGAITRTNEGSNVFRIETVNTKGQTLSRNFTVTWNWLVYNGTSTEAGPLVEADIEAMTSALKSGFSGTYAFVAGGYKYFAYPTSYGTATQFKDQMTNFNVAMEDPYVVSVTNAHGQTTNYNVHRSTNVLGSSINIVVA
jgi:hypothetical protein